MHLNGLGLRAAAILFELLKGYDIVLLHIVGRRVLHDVHSEDDVKGNLYGLRWDKAACSERCLSAEVVLESLLSFLCSKYFQGLLSCIGILECLPELMLTLKERLGSDGSHQANDHDAELVDDETPDKDGQVPAHYELLSLGRSQLDKRFYVACLTSFTRVLAEDQGSNEGNDPDQVK